MCCQKVGRGNKIKVNKAKTEREKSSKHKL